MIVSINTNSQIYGLGLDPSYLVTRVLCRALQGKIEVPLEVEEDSWRTTELATDGVHMRHEAAGLIVDIGIVAVVLCDNWDQLAKNIMLKMLAIRYSISMN